MAPILLERPPCSEWLEHIRKETTLQSALPSDVQKSYWEHVLSLPWEYKDIFDSTVSTLGCCSFVIHWISIALESPIWTHRWYPSASLPFDVLSVLSRWCSGFLSNIAEMYLVQVLVQIKYSAVFVLLTSRSTLRSANLESRNSMFLDMYPAKTALIQTLTR